MSQIKITMLAIKLFMTSGLVVLIITMSACTITNKYGPYYGKVVDKETKEPIEGAAVLFVFYTASFSVGGPVYHYADAIETTTNKNGEFRLAEHRIIATGILQRWDEYENVTIFKPGYGCYPNHPDVEALGPGFPRDNSTIIELPQLKTKEERLDMPSLNFDVPYDKQKNLVNLINQELKLFGATWSYTAESFNSRH